MLKKNWIIILYLILTPNLLGAWEVNTGMGVEYFGFKLKVVDKDNNYYTTLIKSTLGTATVSLAQSDWKIILDGGWSDWNVSGSWEGNSIEKFSPEPFYWLDQYKYSIAGSWSFTSWLEGRVKFSEHNVMHYPSTIDLIYLQYYMRTAEIMLNCLVLPKKNFNVYLSAIYSPWSYINIYQYTYLPASVPGIHEYSFESTGQHLGLGIEAQYYNKNNWGLVFKYNLEEYFFLDVPSFSDFSFRSGKIKLEFLFKF